MGFIVGIHPGTHEYVINGVKYVVESRFLPTKAKTDFADRMTRCITSDFTHLTESENTSTMADEYVCFDCCTSYDVRKED